MLGSKIEHTHLQGSERPSDKQLKDFTRSSWQSHTRRPPRDTGKMTTPELAKVTEGAVFDDDCVTSYLVKKIRNG